MTIKFSSVINSLLSASTIKEAITGQLVRLTYGDHSFDADISYKHYGFENSSSLSISIFAASDDDKNRRFKRLAEFSANKNGGENPHLFFKFHDSFAFLYGERDNSSILAQTLALMELQLDIVQSLESHESALHELMNREYAAGMEEYKLEEERKEKRQQERIDAVNNKYRRNTEAEIQELTNNFHDGVAITITVIQKHSMEPLTLTLQTLNGKVYSDKHSSFNQENAIKYINNSRTEVLENY